MKIIIAGGGTGGHIYPAISIAQAIQKIEAKSEIIFVGTSAGLESKIIPKAGYSLHLIHSGKLNFQGDIKQKIISLIKVPIGFVQSIKIIFQEKPDAVIGVGGYASAPFVLAATFVSLFTKLMTAIWEPNAHPGMANRILSRYVDKSYLVFSEAISFLKSKNNFVLGMPLRAEIENAKLKNSSDIVNNDHVFTILCFGGSQGSVFLNDKLSDFVLKNKELVSKIKIIHQTGTRDFLRIKHKYAESLLPEKNIETYEYIYDMPEYYSQADLLFCRGGASTLAEAAVFGVVPIVVPLPAADDHQQRNAEALIKSNAGFMFLQNSFDAVAFEALIFDLIQDKNKLRLMSEQLKKIVEPGAAEKIARDILTTLKDKLKK